MAVVISVAAGLMLGSFLSVLLGRWPQWAGAGTGRSHCPQCMHELAWYDLVPVVSWAWLRGTCRYCGAPVSAFYPLLELVMGGVLGAYAYLYGVSGVWSVADLVVLFALVALFFFDLKHQMLPDAIVIPLGVLAAVRLVLDRPESFVSGLITGAVLAGLFGILYAVSRGRWLGFGDVKLALVLGLLFGYPVAVGVTLLAVWAGALVGVVLMGLGKATPKTALPFGSFWTAAAVLTMVWPRPVEFLLGIFIPIL